MLRNPLFRAIAWGIGIYLLLGVGLEALVSLSLVPTIGGFYDLPYALSAINLVLALAVTRIDGIRFGWYQWIALAALGLFPVLGPLTLGVLLYLSLAKRAKVEASEASTP